MFKWLKNLFVKKGSVGYHTHQINGYPCYRAKVQHMTSGSLLPDGRRVMDILLFRVSQTGRIHLSDGSSMAVAYENFVWVVDEGVLAEQSKTEPYCKYCPGEE